jgi:hypothetical protein
MTEKKIIPDLLSVVIFPISKMLKLEFANSQLEIDLRTGLKKVQNKRKSQVCHVQVLNLHQSSQLAPKF